MNLSRTWARVVIVLLCSGLLLAGLLIVMQLPSMVSIACALLVAVCIAAALILLVWKLRCVHCGKTVASPRWFPGKSHYCACCGKIFVFDDEPDDAP